MDSKSKDLEALLDRAKEPVDTTILEIPEFFLQKNGAEKIRYLLRLLKKKNYLPAASEAFQPKSDAKSIEARNKGNEFFVAKDYVSALDWYNLSICFAPTDSENLGMGYANRSAVFMKTRFYSFCLQNIDLAMANNYPEKLKEKLGNREMECLELMKYYEDKKEKFDKEYEPLKLTYSANKRIPMMIEGLEIAQSEQYGRFIHTTRDLKPGDVLIKDKSFTKTLMNRHEYKRCTNCFRQNYMSLLPCDHCTRAMFCSDNCRLEANKRFHKYECKIIDGLNPFNEDVASNPEFMAAHAAIQSLTMFDNPQELQMLISDLDAQNELIEKDYANFNEEDHFIATYFMIAKDFSVRPDQLFHEARICTTIWHLLSQYTDLPYLLKTKDLEDMFLNLLLKFIRVHVFGLTQQHDSVEYYGNGVFTLGNLLNHACDPNIITIYDKDTLFVVAVRSIKAGEQLFTCYGFHVNHLHTNLEKRKKILNHQYGFECQCKACLNDYPLIKDLPAHCPLFLHDVNCCEFSLKENFDKNFAEEKLKEYVKKTIELEKTMPSHDGFFSQGIIVTALLNLMFGRPLSLQLK